ncbi:MAG: ion channel [Planctomycetota bacterium]|nr:ion channel [Planctomycetota bacterium]
MALLLHLIVDALFSDVNSRALLGVLTTLILITSLYAVNYARRSLGLAIFLGLPFLASIWMQVFRESYTINLTRQVSTLLFLGFTGLILLSHVLNSKRVTQETLYGAASIYLLLGFTWGAAFVLLEKISPGSFQGLTHAELPSYLSRNLTYFSFVTLTTLGYGEIIPVSPLARSLAIVEAVSGVLYLAFLVARLVAMYMVHSMSKDER